VDGLGLAITSSGVAGVMIGTSSLHEQLKATGGFPQVGPRTPRHPVQGQTTGGPTALHADALGGGSTKTSIGRG
jgi:hypothetical protein